MIIRDNDGRCDACKAAFGYGGGFQPCPCGLVYVDRSHDYNLINWEDDNGPRCAITADECDIDPWMPSERTRNSG